MGIEEEPERRQGDQVGSYLSSSCQMMLGISRDVGKKVD